MTKIYGIDTSKKYNAIQVRDAIIECFSLAHSEILAENFKDIKSSMSEKEFEDFKKFNFNTQIENIFKQINGDFNKPTKGNLLAVSKTLAQFSDKFRSRQIIDKHYNEIIQLINNL